MIIEENYGNEYYGNLVIENLIIILDKDKLVVEENEKSPVLNDCRLGRYILK